MKLGAFSVSLAVKDIQASKAFYEQLGFTQFAGEMNQNWLIMKNGDHIIGLFQNMFEGNILTFNPGWDQSAKVTEHFDDVRDIEARLTAAGIKLTQHTEPGSSGPASIALTDPDGNAILIDQHA